MYHIHVGCLQMIVFFIDILILHAIILQNEGESVENDIQYRKCMVLTVKLKNIHYSLFIT